MPTLLHIDSSPLGDASVSRQLSREFVQNWKEANPNGKIITRDLTTTSLSPVTAEWVGAAYTPEDTRTPGQRELLALSDTLIAELQSADEYVLGVPMHNFGIPSVLKLWIDQIARAGKTFSYASGAPEGLLKGKKATFLIASGGVYDPATVMASFNFVEPYLRTVFGFLGVTETSFINAGGAAALNYGKIDRQTFLQPHLESIRAQFQAA
ncbi:MAG TPA: NAD(P)H-dependent oxidoreductase [Silvibacterium sp.]|jgi:FMN-dependent NADH-azoreductase|nr:NAD(P)H-dependent oxidoreductase [Silvibacterium sp.]